MAGETEAQIKIFVSALAWEQWLSANSPLKQGVWMQFAKKDSGIETVTYEEALDVALCYGWIDGQRKSHCEHFFLQKFTPRRPKSLWSKRNVAKASQLIAAARMQPPGYAEIEAAKQDGRWQAAYDSQKDMAVPEDFMLALQGSESAQTFFHSLSKSGKYAISWRLHTAQKPETRKRRFEALLKQLERQQPL